MKSMFWLAILVSVAAAVWIGFRIRRTIRDRKRAEEERAAKLLASLLATAGRAGPAVVPPPLPAAAPPVAATTAPGNEVAQQRLLADAALQAGEAGEPALAIQLYGRLLARYPDTAFAEQARAAVAMLKKKLVKA